MSYCSECYLTDYNVEDRLVAYVGKGKDERPIIFRNICTSCARRLTKEFSDRKKRSKTRL